MHIVRASTLLFRIHRRDVNPWWFSRDGTSRFDLQDFGEHGTCYLAEEELGSFVEVFRGTTPIALDAIEGRAVSECSFEHDLTLADCTSRKAREFGITGEIHATPNYVRPQAWALAFATAGFDGIRYYVSHDPAQTLTGVALFGRIFDTPGHTKSRHISDVALKAARRDFGLRVLPTTA